LVKKGESGETCYFKTLRNDFAISSFLCYLPDFFKILLSADLGAGESELRESF